MNMTQQEANVEALADRKAWADPAIREFDVETVTEAGGPGLTDAAILS